MKWALAAATLLTVPVAFWYTRTEPNVSLTVVMWLAFLPAAVGVGLELWERWKVMRETPERYQEGSPSGNRIAVFLAIALAFTLLAALMYRFIGRS